MNRLTNVTEWEGRQSSLVYDLANRLTSITPPNGTIRTLGYDADGETTNIVERPVSGGGVFAYYKLNYNAAAQMNWEFAGPLPHAHTMASRR